jgi:hypothetical protein
VIATAHEKEYSVETCTNCERAIGNLEPAHLFNGSVVCDACNTKLRGGAVAAPAVPVAAATARPVGGAARPAPVGAVNYANKPQNDAVSTLIPYKNGQALASYYLGIFSILPVVGAVLGIVAVVLGIRGVMVAKRKPEARGAAHAWVGIICGAIFGLAWILVDLLILASILAAAAAPRRF